jgi:hypothetical protein
METWDIREAYREITTVAVAEQSEREVILKESLEGERGEKRGLNEGSKGEVGWEPGRRRKWIVAGAASASGRMELKGGVVAQ